MSDESQQPSDERREIKIGTQRPGHEIAPPKKSTPVVPVVPTPAHKKIATPADLAEKPAVAPSEPVADAPASPAEVDGPVATNDSSAATVADVTPEPAPAAPEPDLSQDSQALVDELTAPEVELEMSDEDLEREIAKAMGQDVEDLMANQVAQKPTDVEIQFDTRYTATVLKIYRESALFELPGQRNGVVPLRQFEEPPEVGSQLDVIVTGFSTDEQMYELIVPGATVHVEDWSDLQEGAIVEANVTGHNKGGLECEVNHIRAFIPAREISLYRVEDFSTYVEQRLNCVVKEANESRRNLVLSHRAVLEREREEARQKLMEELAVGQTREGTVTRLQKFGAFVDLGGIDGLIHISQLSWDNIRHPEEVVQEGQSVKVRIEKIDPDTGKIGLSYRDLLHHPWEGIDSKYPVGAVVKGTVTKLMDFGAFVKLEPGVEGLVHISELSHKRVNRVSHVVEEGQTVEVKVLSVDGEAQKIGLSIKAALAAPAGAEASESEAEEEPVARHVPKVPIKSLKGGVGRPSGGDQFGLKW